MTITASLSSNYACLWVVICIACITGVIFGVFQMREGKREASEQRGARPEKRERMQVIICVMCSSIMT